MEGHVLTAVPPALWNDEGNGNNVIFGLAIFMPSTLGYHSPSRDRNSGSVEDGQLLLHLHVQVQLCCTEVKAWGNDAVSTIQRNCRKDDQQPSARE